MGWYALAGVVFLAGGAVAAFLVWRFVAAYEPPARFLAPGEAQVSVAAPGDYILWHEHRTVYQGRAFDLPPAMPDGTRYQVHGPDGRSIPVAAYAGMTSKDRDGGSVSVAHFEAPLGGIYRVTVDGLAEQRVVAVAPHRLWPIVKLTGQALAVCVLALGLAIAVGLYGFLRSLEAAPGQASSAQAEPSLRKLTGLVYGLQAASMLVGVTLFAAIIVNYLRRKQVAGTWLESHFTWQIRTFWWSIVWCVVGLATAVLIVGLIVLLVSAVWFVYRIVRGWTELNEGRPMYAGGTAQPGWVNQKQ